MSTTVPPRRAGLRYADIGAAIADVERLRKGHARAGNWTLPQACRHMREVIDATLRPPPGPITPEQAAQRPMLDAVLAAGAMPSGIPAPAEVVPPADCGDEEVDRYVAAMRRVAAYDQPSAWISFFGPIARDEFEKVVLIHAAHHFGHLVPTTTAAAAAGA